MSEIAIEWWILYSLIVVAFIANWWKDRVTYRETRQMNRELLRIIELIDDSETDHG